MMILSFPIVMGILSQDILLTVASALISIIQVIFAFSILILTAGKISRILKVETIGSKKTTMIRIFTMLAYLIVVMTASLLIQWAVSAMRDFFTVLSSIEISYIFIFLLGMIPFPFAPSFLVTMLLYPGSFPPIQWIPTIIGLIIFVILTTWVYKKAVISMKSITSSTSIEVKQHMEKKLDLSKVESIKVEKISPIKAYIKKDLSMATRDIQMFMFLLMPIIMPLLIVFIFAAIPSEEFGDILIYLIITWTLLMFYQPLISLMIISGFLNVEDTGASITASLPLNPRQQVKAKLTLLVTIQTISFFLPVIIILILNPEFQPYVLFFISWYPIALVFLFNGFQMKIRMFGRMKYKFVMEEVNPDKKVLKWAIIIVTQFLVFLGYLVIGGLLLIFLNIFIMSIILVTSSLIILALQFISFNIMFPKNFGRKQMISIRESFQKYPIFGTVVILFFYAIFLFLGGLFEIPLIFIGDTIPFTLLLFIDFFISFGLMLLFWLFIVPRVFYLPERTYTKHDFMKTIGIDLRKNLLRNILIGLGCSILFFIISYSAANIFGMQVFDIDVIFGNPNRSIFRFGWFLFITMLIPGIWEEVSF
ncbi:MAG: hypothetical protein ACFFKA_18040, partial [Candidatus Thorarchaeota archaeon]